MRSQQKSPIDGQLLCEDINSIWYDGWLDSYSDDHFLIRAMYNDFSKFAAYDQIKNNTAEVYNLDDSFAFNFIVNFSAKIRVLKDIIGEKNTRKFFEDQVSAGKANYDEAQFFRALSEIELIRHFVYFNNQRTKQVLYEPPLGNAGKNPEIRVEYENGFTLDIEVKTPGFSYAVAEEAVAIPTLLLNDDGRNIIPEQCKKYGLKCIMPRVLKLKEFLNNAVDKFEPIKDNTHFNLLFINWTFSDFPSNGYLEAYSLLSNDINGILKNKEIGNSIGIKPEVYDKISAIIVYSNSLNSILFQDFRWIWSTRAFAIIPNDNLEPDKLDYRNLILITGMDNKKNKKAPYVLLDFKTGIDPLYWTQVINHNDSATVKKIAECLKSGKDINDQVQKYAFKF